MKTAKIIGNQKGFTLIELMVVAVILAIISAIAVPIYNGYKKEAYAQEAYTTLAMMADSCLGKIAKFDELGGTIGTVAVAEDTEHFTFTAACSSAAGAFGAAGRGVDGMVAGDTLSIALDLTTTPNSKTFGGTLY